MYFQIECTQCCNIPWIMLSLLLYDWPEVPWFILTPVPCSRSKNRQFTSLRLSPVCWFAYIGLLLFWITALLYYYTVLLVCCVTASLCGCKGRYKCELGATSECRHTSKYKDPPNHKCQMWLPAFGLHLKIHRSRSKPVWRYFNEITRSQKNLQRCVLPVGMPRTCVCPLHSPIFSSRAHLVPIPRRSALFTFDGDSISPCSNVDVSYKWFSGIWL